ncbi:hypothetical protein BJV85_002046 [Clostridium acetobutylicum]|uniref:Uncharacterized protein n=2 Tax=Clostridium acetobutylicum TaxID=1488 RepID=Q97HR4_CLOAB|nr:MULTISPECIES: hypothetical protein [Clostridium]AAK79906.1 Hypothetical protein CA_C1944 [Clostridium acetobutylicum ATCC 824]ADZ20997.1 Conserved hypothetical protein [Clostridium acetobutylicum EA 2018]AEI32082.1 hypothetical protein SMB_G1974 [Clostridium acetobutylicum DSM 1731]AWV79661.1 hypothetical protein DK921_06020 [Clostridium acetobutylicum]MBC2394363.1 hypothetical protein [Clostridium acetobutylicum]
MNKKIKTTDTNINIDESTILVVEIGVLSFEVDERYPWIDVYFIGNESKEFITQIDEEKMPIFVKHEELKRFALNWYFNNVEIVKEIKQTAPEVKSQEQLEENFSSDTGEKLHDGCPKCWVKNNKSYNCGYDKCPGYKLFNLEKSKS